MKLYLHPASTSSRPAMMFIADEGLEVEQQTVDIMAGEQYGEAFTKINPSRFVPVLEDGDFRLIDFSNSEISGGKDRLGDLIQRIYKRGRASTR